VIDLMTRKIQRLSAETQRVMTLAACIGNPFDRKTLAIVSEEAPEAMVNALREAINEGVILPVARDYYAAGAHEAGSGPPAAYTFLHDRVQQAAYALIPEDRKHPVHLTVGRLLRARMENDQSEERLFDTVHHLNLGSSLMRDAGERVELTRLSSATMVRLSLVHGNLPESAYGYVTHAITVGPVRGDYQSAYEFGRLALRVNERFHDSRRRAKIYQQFHAHVNLWRQPMQTCIPYAREACRSGLEAGDFLYAAYGAGTETWPALVSTQDLAQFLHDYTPHLALIRKLKNTSFADAHQLILNWVRALRGETDGRLSLSAEGFDETDYLDTCGGNPFFTMFYLTAKLHLAYLFEDYEQALTAARWARRIAHHLAGTIWPVLLDFWGGLTLAACYSGADTDTQQVYLQESQKAQVALAILAENCPENYRCPSLLLAAEIERIAGREMVALDLYEQGIRYAVHTHMLPYQALANELYARFWRDRQQTKAAAVFMTEARDKYAQWGACAKVEALACHYGDLLERLVGDGVDAVQTVVEPAPSALDLFSVMKAAQAIAGEIELHKLPARLLQIAIENAGAERGSLILPYGGEFYVHTEGSLGTAAGRVMTLDEVQNLPRRTVHYVRRTEESVVLANAQRDDRYGNDPYIVAHKPRSLMCLPVLSQARLVAILYLENSVVSGVFRPDRLQVMQLLSSQAAISMENAQLYAEMKQEVASRRQAEEELRRALAEVETLKNRLQEEIRREHNFEEMVGRSPAFNCDLEEAVRVGRFRLCMAWEYSRVTEHCRARGGAVTGAGPEAGSHFAAGRGAGGCHDAS
jgi:GAF domain-containing protein